jgi:hypothetical protein
MDAIGFLEAKKFFESEALRLPLRRQPNEDRDFETFLAKVFSKYLAEFDNLVPADALGQLIKDGKPDAEKACGFVKTAVHEYLCGSPHDAFLAFEYAVGSVHKHFDHLLPKSDKPGFALLKGLYRLCVESRDEGVRGMEFGREGLFHIPFQRREIVKRQRYSIPGLPCLYLGSSLYVCWEELDRPPLHSTYAAEFRVRPKETIRVLDFSETPSAVARSISGIELDYGLAMLPIVARAVCWPLQAACSIRRLDREAPFIAEYIAPQLLLQWVARSNHGGLGIKPKVDGIVYFSVNCEPDPYHPDAFLNFVFPVQEIQSEGHCPILMAKFELTEPAPWQLLESCYVGKADMTRNASASIPLAGKKVQYFQTPFGVVESKLSSLDFDHLP